MESNSGKRRRYVKQALLFVGASWAYLSIGMWITWSNVLAADLGGGNNSTLWGTSVELSPHHQDLVGSLLFMGSLPGFLVAGWLVRALGRRWSLVVSACPGLLGSLLVALAANAYMMMLGRFLEGISFGMINVSVRTYIVEIADTAIRGAAGVVIMMVMNVGSIAVVALGLTMNWYQVEFVSAGVLVVYIGLVVLCLPESPTFLAITGRNERARKVLGKLRGPTVEVDKLLADLQDQNDSMKDGDQKGGGWGFLLKANVLKSEFIVAALFLVSNFSGIQVLRAYASRIFASSGVALDNEISTILVLVSLVLGNLAMIFFLDRVGRKKCLVASFSIIGLGCGALGLFVHLSPGQPGAVTHHALNATLTDELTQVEGVSAWAWVPLASLMLANFGHAVGSGPIPWILAPEYFPTAIRSQAMCVCTLVGSLESYASMQLFSLMQGWLTEAGLYWCYALVAVVGVPYTMIFVRETSGKNVG